MCSPAFSAPECSAWEFLSVFSHPLYGPCTECTLRAACSAVHTAYARPLGQVVNLTLLVPSILPRPVSKASLVQCQSKSFHLFKTFILGLVQWLNWLILYLQVPGSHVGTSLCPRCSFHPDSRLGPRKTVESGPKPWDPAPTQESWKRLLVPGFTFPFSASSSASQLSTLKKNS